LLRKRELAPEEGDFGTAQPGRDDSGGTFSRKGRKRRDVQPGGEDRGTLGWYGARTSGLLRNGETLGPLVRKGQDRVDVRPERGENRLVTPKRGTCSGVGDLGIARPESGETVGRLAGKEVRKGVDQPVVGENGFAPGMGEFGAAQPVRGESGGTFGRKGARTGDLLRKWETLEPLSRKGRKRWDVRPERGENGWFAPEVGDFGTAQPVRGESGGTFGL
jgi:hypothetical protein